MMASRKVTRKGLEGSDRLSAASLPGRTIMKTLMFGIAGLAFAALADEPLTWGGRERHPAVVNPAVHDDTGNVLSLRGKWECTTTCRNAPVRNGVWGFFPGSKWDDVRQIDVPSCWEAQGIGEPGDGECWDPTWDENSKPIRHKHMGSVWYRKRVGIPSGWTDGRIWIKLGGVKSVGWVWVNGRQVALIDDFCGTFKYEITDLVKPGEEAVVVIQVDNRRPSRKGLMSAMHKWGGVYRDVELEMTPRTFIDDVWIRGDFDARTAEAHVTAGGMEAELSEYVPCQVRLTVEGRSASANVMRKGGETVVRLPLGDFRPWSTEHPNLYTAKVELVRNDRVLHVRHERFGIRKLEVAGKTFRLNGKPAFLRGFGDDHIYPLTGITPADRSVHRAHLAKARAAGFNFVRLHTHCEVPEYFEAADEAGILVQAELPYYSDVTTEGFSFDPKRDVTELYEHYRRHPSFAVYSMGNEGSFGDVLDRRLHSYVKALDPDRLKINQDSNVLRLTAPDRSDYDGGPIRIWPRGSHVATRPFVCHEYLNLCVKTDSRTEGKYTGVWQPPVTRADRAKWLARFGLDHDWGDRLQNAQHALQAVWQKRGIECARSDAGCGGYHFWTIVDVVVWNKKVESYTAQGLFDPLWDEKPHGLAAAQFAAFNSPMCVLADFQPSNSVFTAGERMAVEVSFANFGDEAIADGVLDWRLKGTSGDVLASGTRDVGMLALGPVRKVAALEVSMPKVDRPLKAVFSATVRSRDGSTAQSNEWPTWLFPKGPSCREILAEAAQLGVVVAASGSDAAKSALAEGKSLITIDGADGRPNVSLGWWWMGNQVGTAIKAHPAFGDFPTEDVMTPLWFRLVKDKGLKLPAPGIDPKEMIVVGEGGTDCFVYLHERRMGSSRMLACNGLDLLSDTAEGNSLLLNLVRHCLKQPAARPGDKGLD